MANKSMLLFADLHTLDHTGMCPPEMRLGNGLGKIVASPFQNKMEVEWEDMVDQVGWVDSYLCNGDVTGGKYAKTGGEDSMNTSMALQCDAAKYFLNMIKCHGNKYFVKGSDYHVNNNISSDEQVARELGGIFAHKHVVNLGGKRIYARHLIGGGKCKSVSQLYREMVDAMVAGQEWGEMDAIVTAHRHNYFKVETGKCLGISLPCWKGMDAFIDERGFYTPERGWVLLECNGGEITATVSIRFLNKDEIYKEYTI